jgi:hypothetical protein
MSGQWPPEWDDPDDNVPWTAGNPDAEAEAGLSEVAAYLASVPAPLMPGSVEARITAALAVEAAARAGLAAPAAGTAKAEGKAQEEGAAGPRVLVPDPSRARAQARAQARVLRRGARGQRDRRKVLGQFVLGPLAVILLLVVAGFGLSRIGSSSSSSSMSAVAGPAAASSAPASSSAASGGSKYAAAGSSGTSASAPRAATPATPAAAGTSAGFVVSATGTRYQQATLAQQAQAQLRATPALSSLTPSAAPSASASSSAASSSSGTARTSAPSPQLRACVLQVTGGVLPRLVDQATYQGTPVYVIVSSNHVWVVGLGCTATRQQVIASLPLAG